MHFLLVFTLCLTAVAAVLETPQRIVGGSVTTIDQYPSMAAVLFSWNSITFSQHCGGTILNTRSVLSAAHCMFADVLNRWRIRVGSAFANSGGVVHSVQNFIIHPNYNSKTFEHDLAILRTTFITFNNVVGAVSIAGSNYNLDADQVVWAAGWGSTSYGAPGSEQLRHVQIWTVDQSACIRNYAAVRMVVTDNMLCAGWLGVGGHDQCHGDSGGPLFHNGVQVGVCSWGTGCAQPYYPGVNVRLSRYTSWINANA